MTLGECINDYLNEHNMSMRKFAQLAGVTHAYISNIVNGKTSRGKEPAPTITVYRGIANAMGIDVNTLISMVDDNKIAWSEQKAPTTDSDEHSNDNMELRGQIRDELRILYDVAEDAPASAILEAAALIMRYKEQNQ